MALGGIALIGQQGQFSTVKAETKARIKFNLDNNYIADGYTAFTTFVKTLLGSKVTIVDIIFPDIHRTSGYVLTWDRSADTLMVYGTGAAQFAPLSQLAGGTDLSAVVNVEAVVYYK